MRPISRNKSTYFNPNHCVSSKSNHILVLPVNLHWNFILKRDWKHFRSGKRHTVPECSKLTLEGDMEHHSLTHRATDQVSVFDELGIVVDLSELGDKCDRQGREIEKY